MSDEDFSTPPTHGQLSLGPARVQEEMKMRERGEKTTLILSHWVWRVNPCACPSVVLLPCDVGQPALAQAGKRHMGDERGGEEGLGGICLIRLCKDDW